MEHTEFSAIVDLAIKKEEEAHDFYMDLSEIVQAQDVKDTLKYLANEEKKHKDFLVGYKESGYGADGLKPATPVDYKIAEYLSAPDPSGDMESKDVYLIAAHREKYAYEFYKALADLHPNGKPKELLLTMAGEELKHKEKMEYLYTNAAFPQTAGG